VLARVDVARVNPWVRFLSAQDSSRYRNHSRRIIFARWRSDNAANVVRESFTRRAGASCAAPAFLFPFLLFFFPLSPKRESSTSWVDYGVILPRHSRIYRGRVLCRAPAPIVLSRFHARPRNLSHPRKWLEFSCFGFMFHFRAALFLPMREFHTNPERAPANKG
jgi:hypothetical protein